jgi:protein-S-isoprenylcysteine O-methyltransferase
MKFAQPVVLRNPLLAAIFAFSYLSWFFLDRKNILRVGTPSAEDSRTHRRLIVTGATGLSLAIILSLFKPAQMRGDPKLIGIPGVTLIWAGIGLRQWAIMSLGEHWTPLLTGPPKDLVTNGPYRMVRHPAYTGALLSDLGIGMVLGSWLSLLVAVVLPTIGLVSRIRAEENILRIARGLEYETYARGRARLVPGVW